jgi:hypothetical protein
MAITRITKIDAKVKYNDYRSTNDWSDSQITVDTPEAAEITIHTSGASKVKLTRADLLEALGVRETPTVPIHRQPGIGSQTSKGSGLTSR